MLGSDSTMAQAAGEEASIPSELRGVSDWLGGSSGSAGFFAAVVSFAFSEAILGVHIRSSTLPRQPVYPDNAL